METNVRDIILKALENEGYLCELTKEGIIFVDDEDTNNGVAIHIQTMTWWYVNKWIEVKVYDQLVY